MRPAGGANLQSSEHTGFGLSSSYVPLTSHNVILEGRATYLPTLCRGLASKKATYLPACAPTTAETGGFVLWRRQHSRMCLRGTWRLRYRSFVGSGKEGEPSDEPEVLGRQSAGRCVAVWPACRAVPKPQLQYVTSFVRFACLFLSTCTF